MRDNAWRAVVGATVGLAVLAPRASADNGVRVRVNGGGTVFLSGQDVDAARDVALGTRTTTRGGDGRTSVDEVGGTKVSTLAELARIPPRFVHSMAIPRAGLPGDVTLSGNEVRDGFAGDPEGAPRFATVYTGYGHGVRFFRPLRDGGDVNARDAFTTANDGDLVVRLATTNDTVRDVLAHADDTTPAPRAPTGFSARVGDPPGGVDFTYSWDFGDGTSAAGATPSHAFAAGHYRVTVTAVGSDGSSGVSPPLEVQVGTPRPSASATPGPDQRGPAAGGGAGAGGGEGPKGERSSGPARSRGRGERRRRGAQRARRSPSAAVVTPDPGRDPAPVATPAAASGAGASAPTARAGRPSAAKSPRTRAARPAAPRGERVDGILLAGAGSAADVIASVRSAAEEQRSPARRGTDGGGSALRWLGGGGLLVALLGLGAAREGGLRLRAARVTRVLPEGPA